MRFVGLIAHVVCYRRDTERHSGQRLTGRYVFSGYVLAAQQVLRLVPPRLASIEVTVSIGATVHGRGQPIEPAIAETDRCLYQAKKAGRDRVCTVWDE